jgi:uncharacterized membrane protein HdeD (DUF308 family)
MHDHWGLYLGEGIVLILLGLAAIVFPFIAGIVATVFLGWLFLIAGIVGLVSTIRGRQAPGFGWSLLSALAALVAGTVLLWNPLQSLVTLPSGLVILTYVLIAYFIADGILMIILAIAHRRELSGKWEWILVNGVIDLILAGIPRSRQNPKILWVDDAEVVGDRIAKACPVLGDFVAQEIERGVREMSACGVAFVVRDISVHEAP